MMGTTETVTLEPALYEGLAAFRHALRQFLAYSEAMARELGVTPQQYQVLLLIKTHPDGAIMIRDIADQMLLQHNGAVQLIDRLVNAGLVERQHSPTDRRSVLVTMTAQGQKLLEHLASNHLKELLKREPLLAESLRRLRHMGA